MQADIIPGFMTQNKKLLYFFNKINKIIQKKDTDCFLITGESGTGKELIARSFKNSNNKGAPFIPVNCAALPKNLMESELFGHIKGAFTGAYRRKIGKIEAAEGGVLFLDEIGCMSYGAQASLLRVLDGYGYSGVGDNEVYYPDIRVVAAESEISKELLKKGKLREDLYHRFALEIYIPPLRARRDDITFLAEYFLNHFCEKKMINKTFSNEVIEMFKKYSWPGNVRQLRNVVERIVSFTEERDELSKESISELVEFNILPQELFFGSISLEDTDFLRIKNVLDGLPWEILKSFFDTHVSKSIKRYVYERGLVYEKGNKSNLAKSIGQSYKTILNGLDYKRTEKENGSYS